jgi:hypothetical protein
MSNDAQQTVDTAIKDGVTASGDAEGDVRWFCPVELRVSARRILSTKERPFRVRLACYERGTTGTESSTITA